MAALDVLVVGGGPAGLLAGIALGSAGARVLVVERRRMPVDKACGEGVLPTGVALLEAAGVLAHLDDRDAFPLLGVRYVSPSGATATAPFDGPPGLGIRRTALARALADRAAEVRSLEVLEDVVAVPRGRWAGSVEVDVAGTAVSARMLVGADGLRSRVAAWAGLARPARTARFGIRRHLRLAPWNDLVEVHWGPHAEAYVTPVAEDLVGVAFLWRPREAPQDAPGDGAGDDRFESLLSGFPRLRERLAGAPRASEARAVGPLEHRVVSPVADGVALVGDAAGYLDAITGEGISLAAAEADALAGIALPALRAGDGIPSAERLAAYASRVREIARPHLATTRLALLLSGRPRLAERAVRALHRAPGAFRHLLRANQGLASPWRPAPADLLAFARGLLGSEADGHPGEEAV